MARIFSDLDENILRRIQIPDVQRYLRATGWTRAVDTYPQVTVYRQQQNGELREIWVPRSSEVRDYTVAIGRVVKQLEGFEHRSSEAVVNNLLSPFADILRFRLADRTTETGTVPFPKGVGFLSGMRKALMAASCSTIEPQPFHPRLQRAEAEQYLASCKLGQTERGSFVASVLCPIDQQVVQQSLDHGIATFGRQVTSNLMQATALIVDKVASDDIDALVPEEGARTIVSANLCEALVEMQPPSDESSLDISASWSRVAPTQVASEVHIEKTFFPSIDELAHRLRPLQSPQRSQFVGRVDTLSGEVGSDGRMHGEVILALQTPEEGTMRARVNLSADDYATADQAHMANGYISIRGVLHMARRLHQILDYSGFRRVE